MVGIVERPFGNEVIVSADVRRDRVLFGSFCNSWFVGRSISKSKAVELIHHGCSERALQLEVNFYRGLVVPRKAARLLYVSPSLALIFFSTAMNQQICFAGAGILEDDQVERCSGVSLDGALSQAIIL